MDRIFFVGSYLDPSNEELLKDFFAEAEAQVDILERNILTIENDPSNTEAVDEIFRAAHTLKGGAATVKMEELAEFAHLFEDVLDEIRSLQIEVNENVINILLAAIDVIKSMIAERTQGRIYKGESEDVSDALNSLLPDKSKKAVRDKSKSEEQKQRIAGNEKQPVQDKAASKHRPAPSYTLSEYELLELKQTAAGGKGSLLKVSVQFNKEAIMNTVGGIQVYSVLKRAGKVVKTVPDFEILYEDNFFQTVDYYVLTEESPVLLKDKCEIPDVTTKVEITTVNLQETKESKVTDNDDTDLEEAEELETLPQNQAALANSKQKTSARDGEEGGEAKITHKTTTTEAKTESTKSMSSMLRVDSWRVDNLLNLVTEIVINKATFNQISYHFGHAQGELQEIETEFKEKSKQFISDIIAQIEETRKNNGNGKSLNQLKKDIQNDLLKLTGYYSGFGTKLKSSIGLFKNTVQSLSRISTELQSGVMQIRMVHLSQLFSRFPRFVRDLSKQLNKRVNLHMEGQDTELDKSVIEDLLDPLIHCIRNAIDHGIESPDERMLAGKEAEGNINLRACNEGNTIVIEIMDDGRGIDVEKVRLKAVARGLIHPQKILTAQEAFSIIFEPGFSTADNITNVSGRGVGLDVVRKGIEKINGKVSIWSEKGKGTKFSIQLPLTLAIIPGLLVKVGKEIYALPIASVLESVRIKPDEIKFIDNYEVFNLRDNVISMLRLNKLFKIKAEEQSKFKFVVVVGSNDKMIGLLVDELIGEEDVVIKPIKDHFSNTPGIAGATILGDGTVSLIIDVNQLLDFGLKLEQTKRSQRLVI